MSYKVKLASRATSKTVKREQLWSYYFAIANVATESHFVKALGWVSSAMINAPYGSRNVMHSICI